MPGQPTYGVGGRHPGYGTYLCFPGGFTKDSGGYDPVVKALLLNLGKRIVELPEELEVNETKVNWHQWRKKKR